MRRELEVHATPEEIDTFLRSLFEEKEDNGFERKSKREYEYHGNGFEIERVIFNDPATIVCWSDGSKTVVKCEGDKFDQEKGLAMAIVKRILGNKGNYYDLFREYCDPEYVHERHIKKKKKDIKTKAKAKEEAKA